MLNVNASVATWDKRLWPDSLRQALLVAGTSLKTIAKAVLCDRQPLVRTVRWRTVMHTLSMGWPRLALLRMVLQGISALINGLRGPPAITAAA